jgi:hypothetical protein
VSATATMPAVDRTEQIVAAVDHLIQVHDDWEADEKAPIVPTEAFELALTAAVETCDGGDTPIQCRELVTAVSRLGFEWNEYVDGKMDRQQRPVGSFWAAFRGMLTARQIASVSAPKRIEPVAELVAQKVSYHQIAFHIYGHNGKGPFVSAAGQPDVAKILQEAQTPGSVIPPDWVHPADAERRRQEVAALHRRLTSVARRDADKPEPYRDKASVEQLLREGQYPDVIASVKGVGLDEVLATAEQLGITPNVRPVPGQRDDAQASGGAAGNVPSTPAEPPAPAISTADLNARIIELMSEPNADAATVAELLDVTPQKVRAVWRVHQAAKTCVEGSGDVSDLDDDAHEIDDDQDEDREE